MSTLSIDGIDFIIPGDIPPGHSCTSAEAQALTLLRAENIRNNIKAKAKAMLGGHTVLDAPDSLIDEVQDFVRGYASEYQFKEQLTRNVVGNILAHTVQEMAQGRPLDEALQDKALMALARARIKAYYNQGLGQTLAEMF